MIIVFFCCDNITMCELHNVMTLYFFGDAMAKEKRVNLHKRRLICCSELSKCMRAAFDMTGSRPMFWIEECQFPSVSIGWLCPFYPLYHSALAQFVDVALRVPSLCFIRSLSISSSIMADLPIWSDNERIDSEAVLVSVVAWKHRYPVTGYTLFGSLFAIVHRRSPNASELNLPCPIRVCTDKNCAKCMEEAGGYDFRWMHVAWVKMYLALCRPGWWSYKDHRHEPVRIPWFSKFKDGQSATSMVLSGYRNGYSKS